MFVKINAERYCLWRAADDEGGVPESFVTKKRDKKAALEFPRKATRKRGKPDHTGIDRLRSYDAAMKVIGIDGKQPFGRWLNNRAENSHLPFRRRERAMLRFGRVRNLQKVASIHASICDLFNLECNLSSRTVFNLKRAAAVAEWRGLCAG